MLPKYHHHVVPPARISLTLSHQPSFSSIASCMSSGLHPISTQSCCIYVRAGRPAFARSYEWVHKSTSLMSSSLLLQQCPECLVHLILIVFVMGGRSILHFKKYIFTHRILVFKSSITKWFMWLLIFQMWFICYFPILVICDFGNVISAAVTSFYGICIEIFH